MLHSLNGYLRKVLGKVASHNQTYYHCCYRHGMNQVKEMNSYDAVKKLKHLEKCNGKNMIQDAWQIYNNLSKTQQNEYVINGVLNCCKKILNTKSKRYDIDASIKVIDHIRNTLLSDNHNDDNEYVYAKNSLINIYGNYLKDIDKALKVFNEIPINKKNISSVNSMMTAYNNNKEYHKTMELHRQYEKINNDISNLLFIKACINANNYERGKKFIHSLLINNDVNKHSIEFITTIVDFYGKLGDIDEAFKMFNNIPQNRKNTASINSMMKVYNNNYKYNECISLYQKYKDKHDDVSNLLFVKACSNISDDYQRKKLINSIIIKDVNNHNIEFINALIDFYGKTGDINNAVNIFNKISANKKDIVCINSMMNAYNNNEEYDKTIVLYETFNDKHLKHDDISHLLFIKACINTSNYDKGKQLINAKITQMNVNTIDIKFITTLIDFYGKSGDINNALQLFNKIPENDKNVALIGSMMNAYNNNEEYNKCISLHQKYHDKHDDISNLLFIKACINTKSYDIANKLIDSIKLKDINSHKIEFITTIIDFYGKIGNIHNASRIFNSISSNNRDVALIGSMMNAFNENEEFNKGIKLYELYNGAHNDISNVLFIKACINTNNYDKGKHVIDRIQRNDINSHSIKLINTLIDFHAKFGDIEQAFEIFKNIPSNKKDIVSVNCMMNGYNQNQQYNKTVSLYEEYSGKYDDVSNLLFIKACINMTHYDKVIKFINANISEINDHSLEFINTLIDFYGKIGDVCHAFDIFNRIPSSKKGDIASIGSMMNAYNNNEEYNKAISLYEQYIDGRHDDVTDLLYIKACINTGNYDKAKKLIDSKFPNIDSNEHSIEFVTTLIDLYGKTGELDNAFKIFNNRPAATAAMMTAYNDNKEYRKTLDLFNKTKDNDKDEYIYCHALVASGNLVSPYKGSLIIDNLKKNNANILKQSLYVQSAMITMNAKCNNSQEAINIFNDSINKYSASKTNKNINGLLYLYSSMMDCYAKKGDIEQLLSLFDDLKNDKRVRKIPKVIFNTVLNGCAHSGLIDKAVSIFDDMKDKYKFNGYNNIDIQSITPLIDCLGRKGHLDDAENLYTTYIENNKSIHNKLKLTALKSLLSSCRIHNDVIRGQRIFDKIDENCDDASVYVILSNIYGQNGSYDKVDEIREKMKEKGIKKKPGISWIELDGITHSFIAGDKAHPDYDKINKEMKIIKSELTDAGHIFDESEIRRQLNDNESIEDHLCGHSERLALIYGLIMTQPGTPLVIAKNLRICRDCHNAFKLISSLRNRKISVRDANRWHVFENRQCSCNDYF